VTYISENTVSFLLAVQLEFAQKWQKNRWCVTDGLVRALGHTHVLSNNWPTEFPLVIDSKSAKMRSNIRGLEFSCWNYHMP